MKTMRTILIILVILLTFVIATFAEEAETWDLDRCITSALSNSPALQASRHRAEAAEQSWQVANASRLPNLGLNGKADWISETMELELPSTPLFTMPNIEFGDGTNYDLALALNTPLFTGGALKQYAAAEKQEVEASRYDVATDSLKLLYEVRGAYFRSLAAEDAVRIAKQARDGLKRHLEEVQGLIEQGMATREALLLTQARLSDAEKGVVSAESRLRSSRLAIGQLVGTPGVEIIPDGSLDSSILPEQGIVESTLGSRPDLLALDARYAGNQMRADAVEGSLWPTLSAQAAMHYGKPGINQIANEWMDYATVGVRMSWTLFDWGQRRNQRQQVETMNSALNQTRRQVADSWQTRLSSAHIQLSSAVREQQLAEERQQLYKERFDLLNDRYRQGLATESERLDAEDEWQVAELSFVAATANIRLAETDLLFILGK